MPTRNRCIRLLGSVLALSLLALGFSDEALGQSAWQKMKLQFLEQACRGGDQNSCRQLAQLKQKLSQQGQAQPAAGQTQGSQPGQQPPQPGQQPSGRGNQQANFDRDGSGPIHPPNGTKVEEKILAPLANRAQFFVSPHGVHVATVEPSGSRVVVYYDGEPGPKFDQILGGEPGASEVVFSPDGKRYAYCGRLGTEMILIVDGKEFLRTSESDMGAFNASSCDLGFTSNSKHLFLYSAAVKSTSRGDGRIRFIFDGQDIPGSARYNGGHGDFRNIVFSPDGNHYATIVTDPADETKWSLVVDGKMAPYRGGPVQWSADSQHLYTTIEHSGPNSNTEAMLDGKVFMRADHLRLFVAPAGNMTVAIVDAAIHTPSPVQFLAVDGKKVPGSEIIHERGATIDEITFSPDGKHYAARYTTTQNRQYLLVDGKRAQEYQKVDHVLFTSDSSKVTYTAFARGPYAIIGDQESEECLPEQTGPVIDTHGALVIAPVGGRAGSLCGVNGGDAPTMYLDGKTLRLPEGVQYTTDLRFSPDGQHYAYRATFHGGGQRVVVDGVVQMNSNLGTPSTARYHYVFSPDSQHIASDSAPPNPAGEFASGIFLDGKYIPVAANPAMKRLEFTADSQHIVWAQGVPSRDALRIFVDGKAVAEGDTAIAATSGEGWWDMLPDGSLAVLVKDDSNLKRITITPSHESTLATMGGGGTMFAKSGN